jgi:DNA invertase Pin-like site-specific DNA recombinase
VKAGLVRARAAGRRFGRPRTVLDASRVERLLADGLSIREVARRTGYSRATIARRFGCNRMNMDVGSLSSS